MIPYEGAFASSNPRAVVLAGSFAFRAGPEGLAVARFAWADTDTGLVSNERTNPQQLLGFVAPLADGWLRMRVHRGLRHLPPGGEVTMYSTGDFYARFCNGATAGQPVYASLVDGSAISGQAPDAELTPWSVVADTGPGQLAIISTWSKQTS